MTGVTGKISQKNVSGAISQINVKGRLTQKNVSGLITQGGYYAGPAHCPEYDLVYNAMLNKPIDLDEFAQNWMVEELVKTRSLWSRTDLLGVRAIHNNDNGEAWMDWKQPSGGASLMKPGRGTFDSGVESWVKAGNNIIGNDSGALKITYVDSIYGANVTLSAAKDLTTNLTIGKTYKIWIKAKVNAGSSINIYVTDVVYIATGVIATNFTWYSGTFLASSATGHTLSVRAMAAGEIAWIDQWYIQEWTGATAYNLPIFTPRQGVLYNGTTKYANLNWVPSVNGVNYTQNSASQILYIRQGGSLIATYHGTMNNADTKDCCICTINAASKAVIRTNDATLKLSAGLGETNGLGLFINTRTAAAVNKLYRNGTAIINGTTASIGVPTHSPYEGAYDDDNVAAGFRADQVAIHQYLDGCNQDDVTELSRILNGYMTLLGTNVY